LSRDTIRKYRLLSLHVARQIFHCLCKQAFNRLNDREGRSCMEILFRSSSLKINADIAVMFFCICERPIFNIKNVEVWRNGHRNSSCSNLRKGDRNWNAIECVYFHDVLSFWSMSKVNPCIWLVIEQTTSCSKLLLKRSWNSTSTSDFRLQVEWLVNHGK
jgi:hypothetical protein